MSSVSKSTNTPNRKKYVRNSVATLNAYGQPMVWLSGGGLAIATIMIIGLLLLVFYQGISTLWPKPIVEARLADGRILLGEITRTQSFEPSSQVFESISEDLRQQAIDYVESNDGNAHRILLRTANYELTGEHFTWVSDFEIMEQNKPEWAITIERATWGRFNGYPKAFYVEHPLEDANTDSLEELIAKLNTDKGTIMYKVANGLVPLSGVSNAAEVVAVVEVWDNPEDIWRQYKRYHKKVLSRLGQRKTIEKRQMGAISHKQEKARLDVRSAQMQLGKIQDTYGQNSPQAIAAKDKLAAAEAEFLRVEDLARVEFARLRSKITDLNEINSRYRLQLTTSDQREKTITLGEIVRAYPANRLNVFQKIKVYLSRWWEFLTDDPREANMEGGVFPAIFGTVIMTLIMSIAVVPFGVLAALYLREYAKAGPMISAVRIAINNLAGVPSIVFGVFGLGFFCYLVGANIDQLFFEAKLPNPTFGTGGIMWASFTLALLTLPVVIVATEEALAAVPGSMREGSYACGAGKWQTLRRIVLPRAMPGIMTGMILAMARGAGEVAPLMLVGAVKMAPELPIDSVFPYLHPQRSFMHLGFHIFDLGFQSQNSEAAKPMVFTTTLLLIAIVAGLNFVAIVVRTRLRRNFVANAF